MGMLVEVQRLHQWRMQTYGRTARSVSPEYTKTVDALEWVGWEKGKEERGMKRPTSPLLRLPEVPNRRTCAETPRTQVTYEWVMLCLVMSTA